MARMTRKQNKRFDELLEMMRLCSDPPPKEDIQAQLAAHIEATRKMNEYAAKGLKLLEAGDVRGAREAHREGEVWKKKKEAIEARHGGEQQGR